MPGADQQPADKAQNSAADLGTGGRYGSTPYVATGTTSTWQTSTWGSAATGTQAATSTFLGTGGATYTGGVPPADPFAGSSFQVITDIRITPQGSHVVGGYGCPAGYAVAGSFTDCGGGRCIGNQLLCVQRSALGGLIPTSPVLTGFTMTPEHTHVAGGYPCATGFVAFGSVTDCGSGPCYGDQTMCKLTVPRYAAVRGMAFLTDLSVTPENSHIVGGTPCPQGFALIATTADCGNGACGGNQSVCVRTATP